jgi:hypothetical protein
MAASPVVAVVAAVWAMVCPATKTLTTMVSRIFDVVFMFL